MEDLLFRKIDEPLAQMPRVELTIDGMTACADAGDSVAAVLLRQALPCSRTTPVKNSPRTPYCMMGVCFDCLAKVDGIASVQTCLIQVRQGMQVERQRGRVDATTHMLSSVCGAHHPDGEISGDMVR